ncbi:hypothetical protein [Nitrosopumilus sp.]|uniref:hypothetical protein n=1 Tax=Nitrosopumilus sp. TaxID=2024843 RepID=UPI0034A05643
MKTIIAVVVIVVGLALIGGAVFFSNVEKGTEKINQNEQFQDIKNQTSDKLNSETEIDNVQRTEIKSDFETRKQFVLDNLKQIEQEFTVKFDKDLSSKLENGATFQTYKIIHKTDGNIGDLTFYYGKPDVFHTSKFDNFFQTSVFLSNENGIVPTTHSLPIVKNILSVLIPVWTDLDAGENGSEWVDNVIKNAPVDQNDEQSGIIDSEKKEVEFNYKKKSFGYYKLLITDKTV